MRERCRASRSLLFTKCTHNDMAPAKKHITTRANIQQNPTRCTPIPLSRLCLISSMTQGLFVLLTSVLVYFLLVRAGRLSGGHVPTVGHSRQSTEQSTCSRVSPSTSSTRRSLLERKLCKAISCVLHGELLRNSLPIAETFDISGPWHNIAILQCGADRRPDSYPPPYYISAVLHDARKRLSLPENRPIHAHSPTVRVECRPNSTYLRF